MSLLSTDHLPQIDLSEEEVSEDLMMGKEERQEVTGEETSEAIIEVENTELADTEAVNTEEPSAEVVNSEVESTEEANTAEENTEEVNSVVESTEATLSRIEAEEVVISLKEVGTIRTTTKALRPKAVRKKRLNTLFREATLEVVPLEAHSEAAAVVGMMKDTPKTEKKVPLTLALKMESHLLVIPKKVDKEVATEVVAVITEVATINSTIEEEKTRKEEIRHSSGTKTTEKAQVRMALRMVMLNIALTSRGLLRRTSLIPQREPREAIELTTRTDLTIKATATMASANSSRLILTSSPTTASRLLRSATTVPLPSTRPRDLDSPVVLK